MHIYEISTTNYDRDVHDSKVMIFTNPATIRDIKENMTLQTDLANDTVIDGENLSYSQNNIRINIIHTVADLYDNSPKEEMDG